MSFYDRFIMSFYDEKIEEILKNIKEGDKVYHEALKKIGTFLIRDKWDKDTCYFSFIDDFGFIDERRVSIMLIRKVPEIRLFRCNTELTEVAEWCIAKDKQEAYKFFNNHWANGDIIEKIYLKKYLKSNPSKTIEDFIEYFLIEEDLLADFTHPYGGKNNKPITKKVMEWLEETDNSPSYFCHEKFD